MNDIKNWDGIKEIYNKFLNSGFRASEIYFHNMTMLASHSDDMESHLLYLREHTKELLSSTRSLGGRGMYHEKDGFYNSPHLDHLTENADHKVSLCNIYERFTLWRYRLSRKEQILFYNSVEDFKEEEFKNHFDYIFDWNKNKRDAVEFLGILAEQLGYIRADRGTLKDDALYPWYYVEAPATKIKFAIAVDKDLRNPIYNALPFIYWTIHSDGTNRPENGTLAGAIIKEMEPYYRISRMKYYVSDPEPDNTKSFMLGVKAALTAYKLLALTF